MMTRLVKGIVLGLSVTLLGIVISFSLYGFGIEENFGLSLLYKLRGVRTPPADVLIVAINEESAEKLNQSNRLTDWSRSVHAQLTEILARAGARVIAYDVFFDEATETESDELFAASIHKAGNVVLVGRISKESEFDDDKGNILSDISSEVLTPPIPILNDAAVGMAPFCLPTVSTEVRQCWTFKMGAGDVPTLPVVAFQIYALEAYDEFVTLIKNLNPSLGSDLPAGGSALLKTRRVDELIQDVRNIFLKDATLAEKMHRKMRESEEWSNNSETARLIKSLIRMYTSEEGFFLNLYGPAGTITTIPYHKIISLSPEQTKAEERFDFNGKAVFIGLSETSKPTKTVSRTPFDKSDGVRVDGVEIAATVFANLLENKVVKPAGFLSRLAAIALIGMALGVSCYLLPPVTAAFSVVGLCILYTGLAWYQFKVNALWFPIIIPVLLQALVAFVASVVWKNVEIGNVQERFEDALKPYFSDNMVAQILKETPDLGKTGKTVFGTCFFADAENFVPKSEIMSPEELFRHQDKYFQPIFKQIKKHGGIVQDIAGDQVFAIWTGANPDLDVRRRACLAALDVATVVDEFNRMNKGLEFPTRIGLHSGTMFLGNTVVEERWITRAIGNIVNTASRIENLNKHLDTKTIVSTDVLERLEGFLTRELGLFLLAGKSNATQVHELIGWAERSTDFQRTMYDHFKDGLDVFKTQSWEEAIHHFRECLKMNEHDGPSLFYIEKCEDFRKNPPGGDWNGEIAVEKK
jgi:adenylate cyclase